ncbi:MAG TPA: DNA repair protein RecO [Syntrophales bacterium]|nr:DNA repair protein RecO [Syntrophales bacterium]HPQ44054.1 DNA repair protein RecO [Syntrophales bacterium]
MKRPSYKTEAFVLRFLNYGESDRIVTFFTREFGKIRGIAKGARRSRKRFSNAIEPFSHSILLFSRMGEEGLSLIENCDVIDHYPHIRENLQRTMTASYMIDLIHQFTDEGKKSAAIFQLLAGFLELLEAGNGLEETTRFFELRLLALSGYEPSLERCIICNTSLAEINTAFFDAASGGIRCSLCSGGNLNCIPVSTGTLKTLLMGKKMETNRIPRLILSENATRESGQILRSFICHTLGKEPKSLQVLDEIKRLI